MNAKANSLKNSIVVTLEMMGAISSTVQDSSFELGDSMGILITKGNFPVYDTDEDINALYELAKDINQATTLEEVAMILVEEGEKFIGDLKRTIATIGNDEFRFLDMIHDGLIKNYPDTYFRLSSKKLEALNEDGHHCTWARTQVKENSTEGWKDIKPFYIEQTSFETFEGSAVRDYN